MSMKAIRDVYSQSNSIAPQAVTASVTGSGVDLANVLENMFAYNPGTWVDGTHTPKLQDSTDNTTFTDCTAADLVGAFSAVTSSSTAVVQKVSYIGFRRYVRGVITVSGATSGCPAAITATVRPRKQPAP